MKVSFFIILVCICFTIYITVNMGGCTSGIVFLGVNTGEVKNGEPLSERFLNTIFEMFKKANDASPQPTPTTSTTPHPEQKKIIPISVPPLVKIDNKTQQETKPNEIISVENEYEKNGNAYVFVGLIDKAEREYKNGLTWAQKAEDRYFEAVFYNYLSIVALMKNQPTTAQIMAQNAQRIFEKLDDKIGLIATYTSLGNVHFHCKNWNKAENLYTTGLKYAEIIKLETAIQELKSKLADLAVARNKK